MMSIMSHMPDNIGHTVQLARLVLAKFSYTTTSTLHNVPLNWNHIIGQNDIIAVFEKYHAAVPGGSQSYQKIVLKIAQHSKVLVSRALNAEDLNLTLLAQEAIAQTQSGQIGNGKPSVAVIVKSPCLAIRYPRSMGQIRRFQLKFSSDRDYYTALAILSEINCPFTESTAGSSLQSSLRPLSSSSQLRPASASVASVPLSVTARSTGPTTEYNTAFNTRPSTANHPYEAKQIAPRSSISSSSSYTVSTGFDTTSGTGSYLQRGENRGLQSLPQQSPYFRREIPPGETSFVENRPSTAPVSVYHDIESLNQILPPKRELPFARPPAKKAKTAQDPPKSVVSDGLGKSSTGRSVASTMPMTTTLEATSNILQGRDHLTGPLVNTHESSAKAPASVQKDLPQINSEPTIPTLQASATHPPCQPTGILTSTDLSSYLSKPVPERSALVESWVCQQLEDDGFLTLCQDIEGVWKRIAFGR